MPVETEWEVIPEASEWEPIGTTEATFADARFKPEIPRLPGGLNDPGDNTDLLRHVVNNPWEVIKSIPEVAMGVASAPGKLAYAGAADLVSKAFGQPEYGGNLAALQQAPDDRGLPAERFIADVARTPGVPKDMAIQAYVAKSLPELASMMAINPTGAAGKLLALGFSADMIHSAKPMFEEYASEYYKPEGEKDPAKIAQLTAGIIQTFTFAPLAGAHGLGEPIGNVARDFSTGLDNARRFSPEAPQPSSAEYIAAPAPPGARFPIPEKAASVLDSFVPKPQERLEPEAVSPKSPPTGPASEWEVIEQAPAIDIPGHVPATGKQLASELMKFADETSKPEVPTPKQTETVIKDGRATYTKRDGEWYYRPNALSTEVKVTAPEIIERLEGKPVEASVEPTPPESLAPTKEAPEPVQTPQKLPNAGAYEDLSPELKAKSDAVKGQMAAEFEKLKQQNKAAEPAAPPPSSHVPDFPSVPEAKNFNAPKWDKTAGERGAFVSTSKDGQFEAIAEKTPTGTQFWLVRTSDGETIAERLVDKSNKELGANQAPTQSPESVATVSPVPEASTVRRLVATDKSVRDMPQQAIVDGDKITIVSKVGSRTANKYTIPRSEWDAASKHPNPNFGRSELIGKYTKELDEQSGGVGQAQRIRDSQVQAIKKALAQEQPKPQERQPEAKPKPVLKSIRAQAAEFKQLALKHAPKRLWGQPGTIEAATSGSPVSASERKANTVLGVAAKAAQFRYDAAVKVVLQQAAKELGLDPGRITGDLKYRAANLEKIKALDKQSDAFSEATRDEGDSSGKIGVEPAELKVGDVLDVDGEKVKVKVVNRDYVELEDGRKFGKQTVPSGETIYVEGYEPKAEEPAPAPKLRPGEKGTGDLLQGEDAPFNLMGEKGTDSERLMAEKRKAEETKAADDKFQKEHGQDLFSEPTTTRLGKGGEEVSDWTSATAESIVKPDTTELHAGVPLPKFDNRKMSPLDKVTTNHSGKLQKSFDEARRIQNEIKREVPSDRRQSAISVWREANGDLATLQSWEASAKGKVFKQAAKDAQSLTPKEIAIANKAIAAFDVMEKRGNKFDVLKSHKDNYIPHVWDIKKPGTGFGTGMLKQRFQFSKARTFETFFEGDQAGFTPKTLAIGKLLPAYVHEMNKVIADRQMVQDMTAGELSPGVPMAVQRGNVKTIDDPSGKAVLVSPKSMGKADTREYKTMEGQPALANWVWQGKDTDGKPIFVNSEMALHPDVYRRLNSMLGKSAIRQWYNDPVPGLAQIPRAVIRGLDTAQAVMKREMFGLLAPFHQVQEGTHAVGHLVNPFFGLDKIDLRKPEQADAANHGLMLLPDRTSSRVYLEGVGTKSAFVPRVARHMGKAGEAVADVIDGYQDYLFHQYIPALKFKTYEAMLKRNTKLYAAELKSGEMTEADIKITSAEQANAAYGHLNYALLDRNPTIQHIIQMAALAPDFLEARTRFAAQGIKGLTSKVGHEQFKAIAILAAAQAGTAFVLSNLLGVPYDPQHPFEVIYKGRRYAMRSVPEDIYGLLKDTRQFIYGRVNPLLVKGGIQYATGLNYRGEKTDALDTTTELLAGYIPITARSIPGLRQLTESSRNSPISPLEQLAGSLGLRVSRYSPISQTYKLAGEWMDEQKLDRNTGSYPVSKYQGLRYALEDADLERAKDEYKKLRETMPADKIVSGFRQSVMHPFTGSAANDTKFAKTLTGYDKEIYEQALRTRKGLLYKFDSLPKH